MRPHRRFVPTAALALACGAAALASPPATTAPGGVGPGIDRFMKIRAPRDPVYAPDGTLYAIDWPDGINQLYRTEPGAPIGSPLTKVTDFEDGISGFSVSPGGAAVVISASIGGSEQNDLFGYDPRTGELRPLLSDPGVVYAFQHWIPGVKAFVYSANDASPSDFHLYRYDLASDTTTTILEREGWWGVADVHDSGTRMLVARYTSASRADAYELNALTGDLVSINVADGAYNWPGFYLPGELDVTVISDAEGGVRRLHHLNLESLARRTPFPDLDAYDVESVAINENRQIGVVTYNEDGYRSMRVFRLPEFAEIESPPIEKGIIGDVDIRSRRLTWTLSNARTPGLAYGYKVGSRQEVIQLTSADDQGIDLSSFTLPQLLRYPSFDGREIPAFLYTPPGYEPGTPIPFIVNFHGGPEGQSRPWFNRTVQYFVSRGFGVMQPNVRGSVGYGREFHMLDDYRNRWDSVRDGVEAARWLVANGYARPGSIAAYGGSYGGFMAVATVIEGADVFGASVNVVGIVNFQTFLEQTKDYRRKLREAEYGPLTDPAFLRSISPIHRIDDIRVPMLIAHGLNDPRVPVGEAMQLAVGLQRRGYDPELLFFPDEGHGFAKLENRLLFYDRTARFLEREIGF